mgnify:CR=1 FL=1
MAIMAMDVAELNRRLQCYISESGYQVEAVITNTIYHQVFEIRTMMIDGKGADPGCLIKSTFNNAEVIMNTQVDGSWLYSRFELDDAFYFYPSCKENIRLLARILSNSQLDTLRSLLSRRAKISIEDVAPILWGRFHGGYKVTIRDKIDIIDAINRFTSKSLIAIERNKNDNSCVLFVAKRSLSKNFRKRILRANFGKAYG